MKWKIFIITHGPIIEDYYKNDSSFSNEHYTFINVSDNLINHEKFSVINKNEIANFIHLGKWFAEGEAIYNVFKNNLHSDYDYVGFIHWDYELLSENKFFGSEVTASIKRLIIQNEKFISFSTYTFAEDYEQKIMMDMNFPNTLTGNGLNCWDEIIKDYNSFFKRNVDLTLMMAKRINLCSAFLCKKDIFQELMLFFSFIVESKKLEAFDIAHNYRFQGGMMERYIGCFSHQFSMAELPLYHRWSGSFEVSKKSKLRKLISILKSK